MKFINNSNSLIISLTFKFSNMIFKELKKTVKRMSKISLTQIIGSVSIASLSTSQQAFIIFLLMLALDFATGIFASWIEYKNNPKPIDVYFIESKKLRQSLAKMVTYGICIIFVYMFEIVLQIKPFEFDNAWFSVSLTIGNITIILCALVEFYSILENAKRSGFDVIGKAGELLDGLITAKEKITNLITKKDA